MVLVEVWAYALSAARDRTSAFIFLRITFPSRFCDTTTGPRKCQASIPPYSRLEAANRRAHACKFLRWQRRFGIPSSAAFRGLFFAPPFIRRGHGALLLRSAPRPRGHPQKSHQRGSCAFGEICMRLEDRLCGKLWDSGQVLAVFCRVSTHAKFSAKIHGISVIHCNFQQHQETAASVGNPEAPERCLSHCFIPL